MGRSKHVFISHASQDASAAEAVCRFLESHRVRCWIAPRDIRAGTSYPEAIVRGIANSRACLILLSRHANASDHVARELERAAARRVAILAVRLEPTTPSPALEYFLGVPQGIDAFVLADSLPAILDAVSSRRGQTPSVPHALARATPDPEFGDVAARVRSELGAYGRDRVPETKVLHAAARLFQRPAFYTHPERSWSHALYAIVATRIVWEQEVMPRLPSTSDAAAGVLSALLALEDFHALAVGMPLHELTDLTARFIGTKAEFVRRVADRPSGDLFAAHKERTAALKQLAVALQACDVPMVHVGEPGGFAWGDE